MKLNKDTFELFAAKHYENPTCISLSEFQEDLSRFIYLHKLFKRYENNGVLCERLILNHIIVIYNVFQPTAAATELLFFRIPRNHWPLLRTFLIYLNYLPEKNDSTIEHGVDLNVAAALRKI